MNIIQLPIFFFAGVMLMVGSCPAVTADQSVTLAWDASTSSDVVGYVVYYGKASGVYDSRLDVGTNTTTTVLGLVDGQAYFFAVTARDAAGDESRLSNETTFDVPPVFQSVINIAGTLTLIWSATVGQNYQVQYKIDLKQTNWNNLGNPIPATNTLITAFDVIGPDPQRFYRVQVAP